MNRRPPQRPTPLLMCPYTSRPSLSISSFYPRSTYSNLPNIPRTRTSAAHVDRRAIEPLLPLPSAQRLVHRRPLQIPTAGRRTTPTPSPSPPSSSSSTPSPAHQCNPNRSTAGNYVNNNYGQSTVAAPLSAVNRVPTCRRHRRRRHRRSHTDKHRRVATHPSTSAAVDAVENRRHKGISTAVVIRGSFIKSTFRLGMTS